MTAEDAIAANNLRRSKKTQPILKGLSILQKCTSISSAAPQISDNMSTLIKEGKVTKISLEDVLSLQHSSIQVAVNHNDMEQERTTTNAICEDIVPDISPPAEINLSYDEWEEIEFVREEESTIPALSSPSDQEDSNTDQIFDDHYKLLDDMQIKLESNVFQRNFKRSKTRFGGELYNNSTRQKDAKRKGLKTRALDHRCAKVWTVEPCYLYQ